MKKTLLIKPPFSFIPIGMGYVLSSLARAQIPVDFLDMSRPAKPVEHYFDKVASGDYLAVGTGGFVYGINWFRELLGHLRSISPQVPVILGGNITRNVRMDLLMEKLPIDFAVVGEAEPSLPGLLKALDGGGGWDTVPGLVFRTGGGEFTKNKSQRVSLDTEDYLPAYDAIDMQYYIDGYRHHVIPGLGRMMPVLTGRGCKGGCSFCSPTVGRFMPRRVDRILQEIELWHRRYDWEWITFATEIFFDSDDDIVEFCREYKKLGLGKSWSCCFRMDQSPELLPIMKDAGCVMITAGLESASETILPTLKRGCTVDQFKRTLDAVRRAGLVMDSPFMMTNEDETEEDLKKTFDFVIENKMDANFGLVGTYPGTPIYQRACRKGFVGDEWDYMTNRMKEWAWRSPSLTEMDYFNISAIPSSRVFDVVYRQVRRYYTFQYNEFRGRDISLVAVPNGEGPRGIGIAGRCFNCGRSEVVPIGTQGVITVIAHMFRCARCHQKNFLHFIDLPEAARYYEVLASKLQKSQRIMVFGTGRNAMDFYFYDPFGVEMDQIAGFVELQGATPGKKFYHLPLYRLADLETAAYDAVLVTDVNREIAQLLLSTSTAVQSKPIYYLAPSKLSVPAAEPKASLAGVST